MRYIKLLVLFMLVVAVVSTASVWVIYRHYSKDLPGFQALADYQPPTMTRVHAGDGLLIAEFAKERRIFVPINAMPPMVIDAVLAAEDRDFYKHGGVDLAAIVRAGLTDLLRVGSRRRDIGASTITQQVVKNFLLTNEYRWSRKIREAILAVRIEQALSKDRILELYMNQVYLGRNAYGMAAGALEYFNKPLDDLTVPEAAFLAGVLKGPADYDPAKHYDLAKARRDYVIDGMAKIGAITDAAARSAMAEPIVVRHRATTEIYAAPYYTEEVRRELDQHFGDDAVLEGGLSVRTSLSPNLEGYAQQALRDGLTNYDRRHGWRGPVGHLKLQDSDDWKAKLAATPVPLGAAPWLLVAVLDTKPDGCVLGLPAGTKGWLPMSEMAWARPTLAGQTVGGTPRTPADVVKRGDLILVDPLANAKPTKDGLAAFALRQIPDISGALIALDPHTGRVFALEGGWSYDTSQFNRAIQARRQIGSTIKPFAYLAALEGYMTPSTLIDAAPVVIDQGPGLPPWQPRNFESEEFDGPHTLRWAIEHSINTMTVRMASAVGIDKIAPYIERLGIMDHMPLEYSMVLGAGDTTAMRLTAAYAMLVNGGKRITPSLIDRVQDREGRTIYKHDDRACPQCDDYDWAPAGTVPALPDKREQVLDSGTAFQMVNILEGVVQRGTAAAVGAQLKFPLAGKTGTTNGPNDTWFVGFTPDLVVGVYVGFDDPKPLGPREQGASVAAPIFTEFMANAMKGKPPVDFRIPPSVRMVRVDAETGRLAWANDPNAIWEAFKPGTEPLSTDEDESVVEGGQGIQTVSDGTDGSALPETPDYGVGVVVGPNGGRAGQAAPQTVPSSGGLY